jgi:hypothetical protein
MAHISKGGMLWDVRKLIIGPIFKPPMDQGPLSSDPRRMSFLFSTSDLLYLYHSEAGPSVDVFS